MKSTRQKILRTLLAYPGSTINELAEAVGINGISVRHHLTALEADNLITSTEERHGVGRPRLVYSLTEEGVEEFPTNYLRLTQRILSALEDKLSSAELDALFEDIGAEIAEPYQKNLEKKSLEERINLIKSAMTDEGFIVEVEKNQESYVLTSLSCPYYQVGLDHPIICKLDQTVIGRLLGYEIKADSCMFQDSDRCTFKIPIEK